MEKSQSVAAFTGGTNLPADPAALLQGLQNMGGNLSSSGGGLPILRLVKTGEFVYGPEDLVVEEGSEWAMNVASLEHGWVCWHEGELIGEQMVAFNIPVAHEDTLPDYGHPWKQQASMLLRCMSGEDEGVVVLYKSSALGFRDAVKKLIAALMQQVAKDPKHIVPVFPLVQDSYHHKKHGKTFYPVLEPTRWIGFDGSEAASAAAPVASVAAPVVPVTQAAPPTAQADATATNAAASPEAAAGTRRRRRAV